MLNLFILYSCIASFLMSYVFYSSRRKITTNITAYLINLCATVLLSTSLAIIANELDIKYFFIFNNIFTFYFLYFLCFIKKNLINKL